MSLPAVPVILSIPVVPVLLRVGTVWRPCGGCVLHRVVGQASGLVGGGVLDLRLYGEDLVVGPGVGEGRRVPVALEDDPRAFGQPVRYRVGSRRIVVICCFCVGSAGFTVQMSPLRWNAILVEPSGRYGDQDGSESNAPLPAASVRSWGELLPMLLVSGTGFIAQMSRSPSRSLTKAICDQPGD